MPNKQNAKKALRQAKKHAVENNLAKRAYKSAIKEVLGAVGSADVAEKVKLVQQRLAKAAKKGVIKKNTASRKLSRIMKKIKQHKNNG